MQHRMMAPATVHGHLSASVGRGRIMMAIGLVAVVLGWTVARSGVPMPRGLDVVSLLGAGRVYTVADVERGVARDPAHWIGRTVLVRGQPVSYLLWQAPDGVDMQIGLVDAGRGNNARPLSLRWGGPDPLLAFLRRLPMVGRFVPRPQRPFWDMLAVYRIQINRPPVNVFAGEDAVLLDADFAG